MIVEGRKIADHILAATKREVETLGFPPVRIAAIAADPSPATESYLRIKKRQAKKAGILMAVGQRLPSTTTQDLIDSIKKIDTDAVIVQLPLPAHIDTPQVLDAIPQTLDADVLSLAARTAYAAEEPGALLPPVVAAIAEILEREHVVLAGKRAVVIGNGWLVGAPVARWLRNNGAEVEVLVKEDADLSKLKDADIVICGAGSPGLVRPEHLSEGVVLIDAGTSESGGQVVGDADPACAEIASVFTPVPGGVGPVAVACLFRNVLELAKRHRLQAP